MDSHNDFLKRGVARPLSESVDGTFHLIRARFDCGKRIRDRKPQVVMTMHGYRRFVNVLNILFKIGNSIVHFARRRIPYGVRNIYYRRSGAYRLGNRLNEERKLAPHRVFSGEFYITNIFFGV